MALLTIVGAAATAGALLLGVGGALVIAGAIRYDLARRSRSSRALHALAVGRR